MRISDWSSDVCSSDLARPLLETARFSGATLDTALGVAFAESGGYVDAVGDLALIDAKWGPSIGLFQIRSLRDPDGWGPLDRVRRASELRDPPYNAKAANLISRQGPNRKSVVEGKSG